MLEGSLMINILCDSAARYPVVYHTAQDDPTDRSRIAGLNSGRLPPTACSILWACGRYTTNNN